MEAKQILAVAAMYNKIMEALQECKRVNEASNYDGDYLFVQCEGGTHYTNELGDIMPNAFEEDAWYSCKSMEETAAKYTELCMKAGCTPENIYTNY